MQAEAGGGRPGPSRRSSFLFAQTGSPVYNYGLDSRGLQSYGLDSYGLGSYGLGSYGLDS